MKLNVVICGKILINNNIEQSRLILKKKIFRSKLISVTELKL
jgi:hypothetical protein